MNSHPRTLDDLDTPSLILDEARLTANINAAKASCARLGVTWRPHLKTHKCVPIAKLQIASPTGPATVSTVKEAEVFAAAGITDLIYAVGIAPHKLTRIDAINRKGADVKIILDSVEAAQAVSAHTKKAGMHIGVLIEIDCDGHRSGLKPEDRNEILAVARALTDGAELVGVLTHAGGSYNLKGTEALQEASRHEAESLSSVAEFLRSAGFSIRIVSAGSTPTLVCSTERAGLTEVRSGVGSLFDLVMAGVGVCRVEDIAVSVLVSVIGRQQEKGWVLTDGGWMAMSRDRGTASQSVDCGYGLVCDEDGKLLPDYWVSGANQEHGIISRRDGKPIDPKEFPLDRRLRILPNHACPTCAAFNRYYVVRGKRITHVWDRFNHWE